MFNIRKFLLFLLTSFSFSFIFASSVNAQVINEFLPDSSTEWVEIYNASASAEYLKSYYLDDDTDFSSDSGSSGKKSLANLNINNVNYPYIEFSSFLNNSGDYVVLFNATGTIVDQYQYTSNPRADISIGRSPDGSGSFVILQSATKGSANSGAQATPIPTPTSNPTSVPTATPVPTLTPKPVPTKSPTPKPSSTPKSTSTPEPTSPPEVLGESDVKTPSPTPEILVEEKNTKKFPWVAGAMIALGVIFAGVPVVWFLKQKSVYNNPTGENS